MANGMAWCIAGHLGANELEVDQKQPQIKEWFKRKNMLMNAFFR